MYLAELQDLDQYIIGLVAELPAERRRLVTAHDTLAYYAARYGFEVVGTALGSISTEAADPSAAATAALVDEIRAAGVPAIFAETVTAGDLIDTIAREAGVVVAPALYTDALGANGTPGESYVGMMRHNTETIVAALGG